MCINSMMSASDILPCGPMTALPSDMHVHPERRDAPDHSPAPMPKAALIASPTAAMSFIWLIMTRRQSLTR